MVLIKGNGVNFQIHSKIAVTVEAVNKRVQEFTICFLGARTIQSFVIGAQISISLLGLRCTTVEEEN
jgi:hypothetical protein